MSKILAIVSLAIFLSACSNSPSQSDIKKQLKAAFESCKRVDVEDVKKINGMKTEREDVHEVEFSFVLDFDGISGAKKLAKKIDEASEKYAEFIGEKIEANKKLQPVREKIQRSEIDELEKLEKNFTWQPPGYGDSREMGMSYSEFNKALNEQKSKIRDKYKNEYDKKVSMVEKENEADFEKKAESLDMDGLRKKYFAMKQEFDKECRFIHPFGASIIITAHALRQIDTDKFFHGGEYNLNMKYKMVRTDNGWMFR